MALLRPKFRTESDVQNAGNGISGVQISKTFRGACPENEEYATVRFKAKDPRLQVGRSVLKKKLSGSEKRTETDGRRTLLRLRENIFQVQSHFNGE